MKSKDQLLLEAAYSEVYCKVKESSEKVLFDKGKQSVEELTKEINELKEKANNPKLSDGMKKNYEKIIKAMMEKRAELVGKKSINEEGKETEGSLDSLTDDELVSKYREEFDKQFEGSEDSNSHLLKQLYQIALKRGGNVKKKIQSYAISKSELER